MQSSPPLGACVILPSEYDHPCVFAGSRLIMQIRYHDINARKQSAYELCCVAYPAVEQRGSDSSIDMWARTSVHQL